MIPIADENLSGGKAYVVYGLIIANALAFLAELAGGGLSRFSMIPYSVIHDVRVWLPTNQFGQLVAPPQPMPGIHPQWITIFTSMFMHAGFWHLGGNMLYLWVFGNNIEDLLGHVKFFIFYMLCGFLAAVTDILGSMHGVAAFVPTLGASGAIAGVLGAYFVLYPTSNVRCLVFLGWFGQVLDVPAVVVLGLWFVLQLLGLGNLQGGGVAYWAHVGGFVTGAIVILLIGGRRMARRRGYRRPDNYNQRTYPWRPPR